MKIAYFEAIIHVSPVWSFYTLSNIFIPHIYEREKMESLAAQGREKIVCIEGKTKLSGRGLHPRVDIAFLLESGGGFLE